MESLKLCYSYDPETGIFIRIKKGTGLSKVGGKAGFLDVTTRYHKITFKGVIYPAHQVAWAYIYGQWPNMDIDHINGNRADNRITNLRLVEPWQNSANRSKNVNNTSGVSGVFFHIRTKKWNAQIASKNVRTFLGSFDTKAEAIACRKGAELIIFGEYAPIHLEAAE